MEKNGTGVSYWAVVCCSLPVTKESKREERQHTRVLKQQKARIGRRTNEQKQTAKKGIGAASKSSDEASMLRCKSCGSAVQPHTPLLSLFA